MCSIPNTREAALLGLVLSVLVAGAPATAAVKTRPPEVVADYMVGLMGADLTLENEHGFYSAVKFLEMLRSLQRVLDKKPVSSEELGRASRALGYVQGVMDAFLDGAFVERVRAAKKQQLGRAHPLLCMKQGIKTRDVIDATVRMMERLPKETLDASNVSSFIEGALLENDFYAPCPG